jgi:hypothetical protein
LVRRIDDNDDDDDDDDDPDDESGMCQTTDHGAVPHSHRLFLRHRLPVLCHRVDDSEQVLCKHIPTLRVHEPCEPVTRRYTSVWPVTLVPRPFFLGGVMKATNNQPPAMLPERGRQLQKDVVRTGVVADIPMRFPTVFPLNTVSVRGHLALLYVAIVLDCCPRSLRRGACARRIASSSRCFGVWMPALPRHRCVRNIAGMMACKHCRVALPVSQTQRFLTAVKADKAEPALVALTTELFRRYWMSDLDVASADSIREAGRAVRVLGVADMERYRHSQGICRCLTVWATCRRALTRPWSRSGSQRRRQTR